MNKKKGFTLIELLAVIIIIGIVGAIVIISVKGIIDSSADKSKDILYKEIVSAADKYFAENPIELNKPNPKVLLVTLVNNGYLKDKLVNPDDKEDNINLNSSCVKKKTIDGDKKYTYRIVYTKGGIVGDEDTCN